MSAAANYAFVNRQILTHLVRKSFSEVFNKTPEDLDMNVVYDVV
jgi:tRNA-splicing ligase RtcB